MKNIVLILAILFSFYACKKEIKNTTDTQQTEVSEKINIPTLALNEFDSKAGDFVNKEVLVKGIVDHVCKHGGKKILLVTNDGDVHVTSDERFDEALMGSEIVIKGIVLEEIIDEAYCLKMEDDNIKSHSEGKSNEDQFKAKKEHIQQYRDQMKAENIDHISLYSLKYISHTVVE